MNGKMRWIASSALVLIAAASGSSAAAGAEAAEGTPAEHYTSDNEIIVSARKRDETLQETPVAMTVISEATLERYAVTSITSLAQFTPGLNVGESSGSVGGNLGLRGIGTGEASPLIDQAVSVNVDGVQISSAQILRAAQLDLRQVEVLRGPQALFFGKNSPGGIISLISEDPGSDLDVLLRAGYEFRARERYGEAIVSAPLTDRLGLRVAGRYARMGGYWDLVTPDLPGVTPYGIKSFPKREDIILRGTLLFEPSDRLRIRLKGTHTDSDTIGSSSFYTDVIGCPYGAPQGPFPVDDCKQDDVRFTSLLPASWLTLSPLIFDDLHGRRKNRQTLLVGDVNYALTDALTLTSVTGYYDVRERWSADFSYGIYKFLGGAATYGTEQFSQELRLASDFSGPANFLLGGYFEDRRLGTTTFIGVPAFALALPTESTNQRQKAYSLFGQVLFSPVPEIEFAVGGRYTHEIKRLLDFTITPAGRVPVDVTSDPRYPGTRLTFDNFSPEATVTYKPDADLMLFMSYKKGFKSGGFDSAYTSGAILANPARGQAFDPEKVRGFEGGVKSVLLDRQLTMNLTGYWYKYLGLQVSTFDNIAHVFKTQNAAQVRIRGVELESAFRPKAVPGLTAQASVAFNDAKILEYLADCYTGQSAQTGCDRVLNDLTGRFTSQNLAGRRLRKAPKWTGNVGVDYEFAASKAIMVGLASNVSFSSGYIAGVNYQPLTYQDGFGKIDATMRLFTPDRKWELALIGRNLTNKYTLVNGNDRNGTGGGKGGAITCTVITQTGCDKIADATGTIDLPRTVTLQLTFRY